MNAECLKKDHRKSFMPQHAAWRKGVIKEAERNDVTIAKIPRVSHAES
jgi:hypothetical protein